jgi:hypothetical protein
VGIFGKIKSFVKKEKKVIPRDDVLSAKPIRNPLIQWEIQESGDVQMVIPLKKTTKLKVLSYLFRVPGRKTVVLDKLGTEVWLICDGETTINEIVEKLCKKHKMSRKESEISLFSYLQQLVKRGYIGLQMKGVEVENPTLVKKT